MYNNYTLIFPTFMCIRRLAMAEKMTWRERAEFVSGQPEFLKTVPGNDSLAQGMFHLMDAVRVFKANNGVPCGDHGLTSAHAQEAQRALTEIFEHIAGCESRG